MLPSYQIFQKLPVATATEILNYMREEERPVYKTALATLAAGRRMRPAFIQKRPLDKQLAWMGQSLQLRTGNDVAEQLLQVWLLKAKKDMLITFLDEVGIEHDGEGSVEELPDEFDGDKLKAAVEKILAEHDPEAVKLYLHLFQTQRTGGWDQLAQLLESDERLSYGEGG